MKKAKKVLLGITLCLCLILFAGCTEIMVGSTIRIENADGKGTVTLDLPIDYSDGNAYYLPNGTEGLKNAVSKVIVTDLGVEADITTETEYLVGDGGQTTELDHVYVKIAFDNVDEYNSIMKKLAGEYATFPEAEFYYDEAEGGYVFKEHSTVLTNVVINLRKLVCEDTENIDLSPEGQDAHTPDEAANSWEEYIYVGNGTSEYFPHYDYRNEAIGHTYMSSIGNFIDNPTEDDNSDTTAPTATTDEDNSGVKPNTGNDKTENTSNVGVWIGIGAGILVIAAVVLVLVLNKKKKHSENN